MKEPSIHFCLFGEIWWKHLWKFLITVELYDVLVYHFSKKIHNRVEGQLWLIDATAWAKNENFFEIGSWVKPSFVMIDIKLTYCRLFTMFLHCLLSHLKASFHLFTAQQRVELNMKYIKRHYQTMNPFSESPFLKTYPNVLQWLEICAILCKRKDVKGVEKSQPTGPRSRYEPYWTYQVQGGWLDHME